MLCFLETKLKSLTAGKKVFYPFSLSIAQIVLTVILCYTRFGIVIGFSNSLPFQRLFSDLQARNSTLAMLATANGMVRFESS